MAAHPEPDMHHGACALCAHAQLTGTIHLAQAFIVANACFTCQQSWYAFHGAAEFKRHVDDMEASHARKALDLDQQHRKLQADLARKTSSTPACHSHPLLSLPNMVHGEHEVILKCSWWLSGPVCAACLHNTLHAFWSSCSAWSCLALGIP